MIKLSRETRVGLFTAMGITLLYLGYNFLRGRKFFSSYHNYYVVYNNVEGLVSSTPVYINGFKVGQVSEISLPDASHTDQILVNLLIDGRVKIGKGSTARITSLDLLGGKAINIHLHDSIANYENNDTLPGDKEDDLTTSISNMVSPIREKSEQVLVTLEKVLGSLREVFNEKGTQNLSYGMIELSQALHNIRIATERLNQFVGEESSNLHKTTKSIQEITSTIASNKTTIDKTMHHIESLSDSLAQAPIKSTLQNLNDLSKELSTLTKNMNDGKGSLGMMANDKSLYENLNKTLAELKSLLADMQKHPARYVHFSVFGGANKKAEKEHKAESNLK